MARLVLPFLAALGLAGLCSAQAPRLEIGVQLSTIRENVLGEYPLGGGGRVTVHAFRFIDAEAEVNRYPIGGGGAIFPATQVLLGARAGRRFGPLELYGKLRPGFMRLDANPYVPNLGTRAALDIGGVIEFYSSRHIAGRIDFGDTAVWYGHDIVIPAISGVGGSVVPGTRHQLQWSLGISFWL